MIHDVSDAEIRIGDQTYVDTVAVTAMQVIDNWSAKAVPELTPADFSPLLEAEPELIILGTGKTSVFAPKELIYALARKGIGLEVMNTPAAARTFNVLASENRRVAAVLYL
jgi:uncharacterized protein